MRNIVSSMNRVETPFISVQIGKYILGAFTREIDTYSPSPSNLSHTKVNIDFPNYVQSLNVQKAANGLANIYTLKLVNAVQPGTDPNFIDKLLSRVRKGRSIIFNYGDMAAVDYAYKQEEAIITKVDVRLNMTEIEYTITAYSNSLKQKKTRFTFPERYNIRPSELIKEILYDSRYKLTDLFWGLKDRAVLDTHNLIPNDDAVVSLEARENISALEYIIYLVNNMRWINNIGPNKTSVYKIAIIDTIGDTIRGPYFRISRVQTSDENVESNTMQYLDMDIGYPSQSNIISFNVNDDTGYSILYDYNEEVKKDSVISYIDDNGEIVTERSNTVLSKEVARRIHESDRTWWANMTNYPIKATLVVKGLLRNIELLSKVKINVLFYGQKHHYSGIYMVNKVSDSISENGFRSSLELIRIKGISYEIN